MQNLPDAALARGPVTVPPCDGRQLIAEEHEHLAGPLQRTAVSPATVFLEQALANGRGEILHEIERDFVLASGESVQNIRLGFCVYGTSPENPLVVIHPALTGSPRACRASQPGATDTATDTQGDGWWNDVVGPGKLLDTDRYTVMSIAHVGGVGHSSSAAELAGLRVSISDTVRLAAQVLRRHGVREIATVVGGSMGAYQTLYWLNETDISINTLVDLCGSSPGKGTTTEFFAAQRLLLNGGDPLDVARRIRSNCAELGGGSAGFGVALNHVLSKIEALAGDTGSDRSKSLAVVRQIGFLRFVAPGFYDNKLEQYRAQANGNYGAACARLAEWLDRQGAQFQDRFDPRAFENSRILAALWRGCVAPLGRKLPERCLDARQIRYKGDPQATFGRSHLGWH